jgi:tRNA (cmo5U34)-methyltransferase
MADFTFAHREEGFDNHIDKSIRSYKILHDDIVAMSQYFIEDNTRTVDVGCSTGKTIEAMIKLNQDTAPNARYVGLEIADGFLAEMAQREGKLIANRHKVSLQRTYAEKYDYENCNLVTSIFTLQFMADAVRREVVRKIYNGLNPGGAFIFAEKTLASNAKLQDMLTFLYYDFKRKSFEYNDIMEKEKTLRNMLKPMTYNDLISMIKDAGFESNKIQPFWQNHLFVGVIALK